MAYTYEIKLTVNHDNGGMSNINKIILHHWGVDGQRFDGVVNWFMNPASQVSAHYVVQSGRVCQMVKLSNRAWHCYGQNTNAVGIEARPECTDGDVKTVAEVVARIWKEVGKKLPVYGHKDFGNTACPGRYYAKIGEIVKMAEQIYNGNTPVETKLDEDGAFGCLSIKALQRFFGTYVDGFITGQIPELEEYTPALYAVKYDDGDGSMVVEALQKYLDKQGFKVGEYGADGQFGHDTVVALQKFLMAKGYSLGDYGADGIFGYYTALALQKFLNANIK